MTRIEENVNRCRSWPSHFPPERWALYRDLMRETAKQGIPFAIGGGLAAMTYAQQWRDTKDLDVYILPHDRDPMISILRGHGLSDYYDQKPYDRKWIYRSYREDTIVDVIWAMANQRAQVDTDWLSGPEAEVDGLRFHLLRPEEVLWSKIYILQRDRCDWPDAMNMLYTIGMELDWERLFIRVAEDASLMAGLVAAFAWLCPERAADIPVWVWERLELPIPDRPAEQDCEHRANLLDSRPWFTPNLKGEQA